MKKRAFRAAPQIVGNPLGRQQQHHRRMRQQAQQSSKIAEGLQPRSDRRSLGLGGVRTLAVSVEGTIAAWGGFSNRIIVWDLQQHRKKYEVPTAMPMVAGLKFSPDGALLAAAGAGNAVRLYDTRNGVEVLQVPVEISGP